jgi:2-oxoglutarate ferredoxin oxidoreductase subunit alpha
MVVNAPLEAQKITPLDPIINDFAFSVATQNGSGSQTSNNVLVKTLFDMGIPVNGKNLFPSNIKGLPTWYTIRASKHGYTARRYQTEIVVAYNKDTAAEDIAKLPSGGVCILPAEWKWGRSREDIIYYEVPIKELMAQTDINPDFRKRVENMTYVGVFAQLFNMPLDMIYTALLANFGGKAKAADMNMQVIRLAYDYFEKNVEKRDPYRFEPMNETKGKILITGNEAGALGSLFGGVTVVAWYPITPSTSLVDGVLAFRGTRLDPETKKETVAVVQAEDELAAAGMIIGAGWAGARSMTATSGPGISLMAEFMGLAYYAEIPTVVWDITRMGPSTGLPTRTSQGDLLFIHFLGHGDTRQVVLLPANPEEAFEMGWKSFDIADHLQTPVFVASDLDLGMNNWMSEPFKYPDRPINKGKVLDVPALQAFIEKHGKWGRYMDVDGDGIGYRTLPGTDHAMGAYFTRGTGHTEMAVYSERSDEWMKNMMRLRHKIETGRKLLEQELPPISDIDPTKKIGIITFGTNEPAIAEARDMLVAQGIHTNYMRVRALPLPHVVTDFITQHERVYVIENNFDGQLHQIISLEHQQDIRHVISLALGDGLPMTAHWIVENINKQEGK